MFDCKRLFGVGFLECDIHFNFTRVERLITQDVSGLEAALRIETVLYTVRLGFCGYAK